MLQGRRGHAAAALRTSRQQGWAPTPSRAGCAARAPGPRRTGTRGLLAPALPSPSRQSPSHGAGARPLLACGTASGVPHHGRWLPKPQGGPPKERRGARCGSGFRWPQETGLEHKHPTPGQELQPAGPSDLSAPTKATRGPRGATGELEPLPWAEGAQQEFKGQDAEGGKSWHLGPKRAANPPVPQHKAVAAGQRASFW